jgi:transcription termination factor Rho
VADCFSGILEVYPKGYGFVRERNLLVDEGPDDAYVSERFIQHHRLRPGCFIEGERAPGRRKGLQLSAIHAVNGLAPKDWASRKEFAHMTPINPSERINLEHPEASNSMRIIDLVCPIGKGQRGLIVAPPRTGKTVLLQEIAKSVELNHPETRIIVVLIDERPEEVTDMRRSVKGDVFASCNDMALENHLRLAQISMEYARRWVEAGNDVIVLLDSLTRMGRAFNIGQPGSGRTLSGGIDAQALEIPRRIFGAARNLEEGGSLTVLATALTETNSRMDDFIFEEFKGTGNLELVLNRNLADRRIWPAINILESGTRKEELLVGERIEAHRAIRRFLAKMALDDAMESLLQGMNKTGTNDELLSALQSA